MVREASLWELGIWAALWKVNPWGEMRADQRTAIVAAVLANVNRDPSKKPDGYAPRDFMPYLAEDPAAEEKKLEQRLVGLLAPRPRAGMDKAEIKRRRKEMKGRAKS
jgi:hypothetical protein